MITKEDISLMVKVLEAKSDRDDEENMLFKKLVLLEEQIKIQEETQEKLSKINEMLKNLMGE